MQPQRNLWRAAAVLVCAGALLIYPVAAGAVTLSLRDAVARALRDAPEAKIAELEASKADDQAAAARSIYWPHAGVRSQAGWSSEQDSTIDAINGKGQLKRYPLSAQGSSEPWLAVYFDQILFDLKQWRDVERAELEAEAADVAESEQHEGVSYAVVDRYVDVVRLEQLAANDRTKIADVEWLHRQAELLLQGGRALPEERERAAIELEQARLEADAHREQLEQARTALADAIGADPDEASAITVDPTSLPTLDAAAVDRDAEAKVADAPALRILGLRQRMEDLAVKAARAGRYPTLGVRGGYFHYGTKRFDAFEQEVAIGVDVNVPVFDGFRTSRNIDSATKAAEAARLRYEAMRNDKRARVRELQRALRVAARESALAERRVRIATERQRLADMSLQAQRGTLAQALEARAERARAALAAVDARLAGLRLWAQLQRETGRLKSSLVEDAAAPTAAP